MLVKIRETLPVWVNTDNISAIVQRTDGSLRIWFIGESDAESSWDTKPEEVAFAKNALGLE